jgi:hypothetical protein
LLAGVDWWLFGGIRQFPINKNSSLDAQKDTLKEFLTPL